MKIPTTPPSVKVTLPDLPRTQAAADRLRAVFRGSLQEVLLGVAAAGLGFLAGCEPDPFAKYEKRECGSRDWAVNAPVGVNSLTLRSPRELQTVLGKPCLGAQDMAGCLGNFEQATKCEETIFGCEPLVVGTRGDAVFAIKDPAALIELMKPIDTVDEAALVVTFNRYRVDCTALGAEVVRGTDEDSGFEVLAGLPRDDCETNSYILSVTPAGQVTKVHSSIPAQNERCSVGRVPDGLCGEPAPANPTWTLRAFLSESAHLESASVPAFVVLARDLRDLGAPEEFIVASLAAVHDEVAHARVTNQLALEHGGSAWNEVTVEVKSHRTLFDVALENAVEGCVRETFGALVAGCQAMKAQDAAIARTMLQIAQDETRHAALAFAVHEWLLPQLSASERDKIQSAQEAAISSLRTTLTMQHEAEVYDAAGWPQPHEALALHDRLVAQLWS